MTASVWALPRRADLPRDLAAGFTVAPVSVAEGMAYALVAGVDPVYGLYAGSVTVLVGSLFASSTLLVVTATNALALVTAEKIGVLGDGVDPAVAMFTLTLLVGMVMAALGLLRLGSLVRFISAEVQAGLVAAVAILIVLGQYDELVGYASKSSGGKVVKAADISAHVTSWHELTTAVGLGCIVTLVLVKRSRWRAYADIVALVVGTLAVSGLDLRGVDTVGDVARIPDRTGRHPDPAPARRLAPARADPRGDRRRHCGAVGGGDGRRRLPEPRRDPLGHVAGFLGPGAGQRRRWTVPRPAVGRVAVSDRRQRVLGARSRWAGVASGVLLVIIVAVAGKVAELIPLTTLAAILMVIGVEALVREVRHLARARWVSVPHLCAALVTVVVGVVAELTAAIVTGVALSLLLYMFTVADQARIVAWIRRPNGSWQEATPPAELPSGKVTVLALTGGAYFASAYRAEQAFPAHDRTIGAAVVLQLRDRTVYSLTSLEGLTTLVHSLHGHGNRVYLADIDPSQRVALSRSGLLALLGPDAVVWRDPVIGAAAAEATRRAGAWLAGHRPEPSRGSPPKEHQSE